MWPGALGVGSVVSPPSQRKCEQYWGENIGDTYKTPDKKFTVITTSVMPFADFVIRTFSLKDVSCDFTLSILSLLANMSQISLWSGLSQQWVCVECGCGLHSKGRKLEWNGGVSMESVILLGNGMC